MTKERDMGRLKGLARLVLEHRLAGLRSSAACLDQSRMQLAAINRAPQPVDLEPIISTRAELGYERWADNRRTELNLVIARQTADWLDARDAARTAFGRVQALEALSRRLTSK